MDQNLKLYILRSVMHKVKYCFGNLKIKNPIKVRGCP